jgi:hypothetical protein
MDLLSSCKYIISTYPTRRGKKKKKKKDNGGERGEGGIYLAVEEVLQELLHLGDTGGSTDQHDLVDLALAQLGIAQHLLHGLQASAEEVNAEFLEPSSGDVGVEVNTLVERIDFNGSLGGGRQGSLGSLASSPQTANGSLVAVDVLLELPLELLNEVVHETVVEVLTTKMGVSTSGLHLEHTTLDGQEGHIECATTQVEDEHVLLSLGSLVQTIGNSGGCGLIDDTEDVQTGDCTSILGGLTLAVIEIGGDYKEKNVNKWSTHNKRSVARKRGE